MNLDLEVVLSRHEAVSFVLILRSCPDTRALYFVVAAALAGVLSATAEVISDQAEIAEDSPADIQHEDLEDWQDQRKKAIKELRNLDETQPMLIGGSILRDAEKITEILSD